MLIFPYAVDRRLQRIPYATYSIVALNVLVYLACVAMGPAGYERFVRWGGVTPEVLAPHTLLTMHFLHDAPLPVHIGVNMLFLVLLGRHLEDVLGVVLYVIAYLGGGVSAALLHVLVVRVVSPQAADVPMIGASAAIAALMGLFAVRFYRTRVKTFYLVGLPPLGYGGTFRPTSLLALGLWGLWELAQGIWTIGGGGGGGVAHWAHLGGFAFGLLVALATGMGSEAAEMYTAADAYEHFRNGEFERAVQSFRGVLRDHPDDAGCHHKLAVAYQLTNRPQRAAPHMARAVELYDARADDGMALDLMLALPPGDPVYRRLRPELIMELARALELAGEERAALAAYEATARLHTGTVESEQAMLRCGELLLDRFSLPDEAATWFEAAAQRSRRPAHREAAAEGLRRARQSRLPEGPQALAGTEDQSGPAEPLGQGDAPDTGG